MAGPYEKDAETHERLTGRARDGDAGRWALVPTFTGARRPLPPLP